MSPARPLHAHACISFRLIVDSTLEIIHRKLHCILKTVRSIESRAQSDSLAIGLLRACNLQLACNCSGRGGASVAGCATSIAVLLSRPFVCLAVLLQLPPLFVSSASLVGQRTLLQVERPCDSPLLAALFSGDRDAQLRGPMVGIYGARFAALRPCSPVDSGGCELDPGAAAPSAADHLSSVGARSVVHTRPPEVQHQDQSVGPNAPSLPSLAAGPSRGPQHNRAGTKKRGEWTKEWRWTGRVDREAALDARGTDDGPLLWDAAVRNGSNGESNDRATDQSMQSNSNNSAETKKRMEIR